MKQLFCAVLLLLFFLISRSDVFAEAEQTAPINVTSETMEAEKSKRLIVFKGNVVTKQKDMTIHSDELRIYYDEEGKDVEEVIANGNVRVEQENKTATAEKAAYYKVEEKVILTGDAKLQDGNNFVEGKKITVYMKDGRSIVEGSEEGRVKAQIFTNKGGGTIEETFSK
jgi:lipopolysaccharide export system protein LptA